MKQYFLNLFNWASQGLNTVTGGEFTGETTSSRVYRQRDQWIQGNAYRFINAFFYHVFGEENHCETSYANDLKAAQQFSKLEDK